MANTYENTLDNNIGSDAEYQAYIQKFEAAMLASGFLEVAPDTGQINPATVTRPAISTFSGFRMYRAKDSLAASKPYYVKVEYGAGSALDRMAIRRTLATGSNGAGTLTGPTSAVTSIVNHTAAGSGLGSIYGGGGSRCAFVMTYDSGVSSHCSIWALGRLLNQADGSADDPIIWDSQTLSSTGTIGASYVWTDGALAWATNSTGFSVHYPDLSHVLNSGGDINKTLLYQGRIYRNAKTYSFPFVTGKTAELPFTNPDGSMFSLNIWGGMHTFIPIPFGAVLGATQRLCLLWE